MAFPQHYQLKKRKKYSKDRNVNNHGSNPESSAKQTCFTNHVSSRYPRWSRKIKVSDMKDREGWRSVIVALSTDPPTVYDDDDGQKSN